MWCETVGVKENLRFHTHHSFTSIGNVRETNYFCIKMVPATVIRSGGGGGKKHFCTNIDLFHIMHRNIQNIL